MRGADLVAATQCYRVREIRYAINGLFKKLRKILISACRSARNGPCPVSQKSPPESSVPGGNLTGGRRRNQFWRGHGSPSVLNEVFSNLARLCASKSANGPRKNSFRPDSPSRQPSTGDGRLSHPPHHTGHGPFRTHPPTSVKSPIKITCTLRAQVTAFNHIKCIKLLTNIL